jgi:DNA topoisomerase-3
MKRPEWEWFDDCRCDVIIHLFDDAQKVTVEECVCMCGAQLVNVEYKQVSLIQCSLLYVN